MVSLLTNSLASSMLLYWSILLFSIYHFGVFRDQIVLTYITYERTMKDTTQGYWVIFTLLQKYVQGYYFTFNIALIRKLFIALILVSLTIIMTLIYQFSCQISCTYSLCCFLLLHLDLCFYYSVIYGFSPFQFTF